MSLSLLLLLAPLSALTRPTPSPSAIQTIYKFSNFTLENLAPRSNGNLLLTASNQPCLYTLDPIAYFPFTISPPFNPKRHQRPWHCRNISRRFRRGRGELHQPDTDACIIRDLES